MTLTPTRGQIDYTLQPEIVYLKNVGTDPISVGFMVSYAIGQDEINGCELLNAASGNRFIAGVACSNNLTTTSYAVGEIIPVMIRGSIWLYTDSIGVWYNVPFYTYLTGALGFTPSDISLSNLLIASDAYTDLQNQTISRCFLSHVYSF